MKSIKQHTNYVNSLKFSPNGEQFVTVSSDKKIVFYDGKEGTVIKEIAQDTHEGSILQCDWSADGSQLATCSADKSIKIWDTKSYQCIKTLKINPNPGIEDMVQAVQIYENSLYAITYNGYICQWNETNKAENGKLPDKIYIGHSEKITSILQLPNN